MLSPGMPMPVSLTETKILSFFSVVSIVIAESVWLNLIALVDQVVEYLLDLTHIGGDKKLLAG